MAKPIIDEFEAAAREGLARIRAFWADTGKSEKSREDARLGAMMIGAYTRLRGTMANEQAIELMSLKAGEVGQKRLRE